MLGRGPGGGRGHGELVYLYKARSSSNSLTSSISVIHFTATTAVSLQKPLDRGERSAVPVPNLHGVGKGGAEGGMGSKKVFGFRGISHFFVSIVTTHKSGALTPGPHSPSPWTPRTNLAPVHPWAKRLFPVCITWWVWRGGW